MQRSSFILKELSIGKMPGFPRGLRAYRELSPSINIIAGPNASGKSSTARVIHDLIWKRPGEGVQASGSVMLGEACWEVMIDAGRCRIRREGTDDEFAGIPAPEVSGRYMLALHDLVIADESDLARQILKESIGGYDLDEAGEKLGYSSSIRKKSATEFQAWSEAESRYREAEDRQRKLKQQEEELQELYGERDRSAEAGKQHEFYSRVRDFLIAKGNHDLLQARLQKFPGVLDRLTGEEYDSISVLESEVEDARGRQEKDLEVLEKIRRGLKELDLPGEGIDQEIIDELARRVELMESYEREIRDAGVKAAELQVKAGEALKSIDPDADMADWRGIRLDDVAQLDRFLSEMHRCLSEKQFFETRLKELTDLTGEAKAGDREKLKEGIKALGNWLQEEKSIKGIRSIWIIVVALAGIASGLLAWLFGLRGLAGVLLVILAALAALFTRPAARTDIRKKDYQKTGFSEPVNWDTEGVTGTLETLVSRLAKAERIDESTREAELLRKQLTETGRRLEKLREQGEKWLGSLRAIPSVPDQALQSYSGLYWFLVHAGDWQKTNSEMLAVTAGKEEISRLLGEELQRVNDVLVPYKTGPAGDPAQAKSILARLEREAGRRRDYLRDIAVLEEKIGDTRKQIEKAENKLAGIYGKLGIEPGHKELIRDLTDQLEEFRKVRNDLYAAAAGLEEKEAHVRQHPLSGGSTEKVAGLSVDEVNEKIDSMAEAAGRMEGISNSITGIETRISMVRQGHDLENALMKRDNALAGLGELFERNLSSATGQLLVDHLKRETGEQNRPRVFRQAGEMLQRITGGRYQLRIDEKGGPAFRAYDTVLGLGQELGELSTGTRIQLLLAVRLAFIENQESFLKLPLLADELLANSDDIRARAIIEALAEISRDGRQVFYFTAQSDEVARWQHFLDGKDDLSLKIVRLAGTGEQDMTAVRGQRPAKPLNLIDEVPAPEGMSHEEYRSLLSVPHFNIMTDQPESLHLWYLTGDDELLCRCLRSGIRYWGQLQSYLDVGRIEGLTGEVSGKMEQKVRLLQKFLDLYRQGRPKPVDMDILRASGAVSDSHFEAVALQLGKAGNDPVKLLDALRKGEVPRFLKSKVDDLEQYLTDRGYIDDQIPLETESIIVHLNAYISNLDIGRSEAQKFINRVAGF